MAERLYRSRRDRVLGGVAVGLAEYWNMDPIIVRILFIIVALMTGIGFFLYIILWIIVPEESYPFTDFGQSQNKQENKSETAASGGAEEKKSAPNDFEYKYNYDNHSYHKQSNGGRIVGGIVLIALGIFFLAERIFPYFDFVDFFPLLLIGIGLVLILNSNRKKKNAF